MPGSAVNFILMSDGYVLMEWREDHPFLGKWVFPGGRIEPGEESVAAMYREAQEECGIQIHQALPLPERASGTWTIYPFLVLDYEGEIPEQTDAGSPLKWVPLDFACTSPWSTSQASAAWIRDNVVTASSGPV